MTGEVLANTSCDFWYSVGLADTWLKNEDILVFDHLGLILFVRPDSEVAEVFGNVDALPVLVIWDKSGEIRQRHTVHIS